MQKNNSVQPLLILIIFLSTTTLGCKAPGTFLRKFRGRLDLVSDLAIRQLVDLVLLDNKVILPLDDVVLGDHVVVWVGSLRVVVQVLVMLVPIWRLQLIGP